MMNWTASVNDSPVEWPIQRKHHFLGEVCQYAGECAILEHAAIMADGIENFLGTLERLEAIERALLANPSFRPRPALQHAACGCIERGDYPAGAWWTDASKCDTHRDQAESANRRY